MQSEDISNTTVLQSALKKALKCSPESHYLQRLHCVLLVTQGCCCHQVAEWLGIHQRTVERWVHYFYLFGVEGLKDEQKIGRPSKVRDDQRQQLLHDVFFKPADQSYNQVKWSGKRLKMHLKQRYEIDMSVRQCQRLLQQLQNSMH